MEAYLALEKALHDLRLAEDELCRPEEDVLTTCSCYFMQSAINGLFLAYLKHRSPNAEYSPGLSSSQLLAMCSQVDIRFKGLDLSGIECRNHVSGTHVEVAFCQSIDKSNQCLNTTRSIKELVLAGMQVKESDIL